MRAMEMELSPAEQVNQYQPGIPDVLFVFENYPYEEIQGQKIRGKLLYNHELTGYPLTLLMMPAGSDFKLKIIFDQSLFSQQFIEGFASKFKFWLHEFCESNSEPVFRILPGTTEAEPNRCPFPDWYSVTDFQLENSGCIVSASSGNQSVFFKDFHEIRKNLASHFSGLPLGSRIGVYGPKNAGFPALVYSLMRNGFVYVPLNPAWPADRLAETIRIAGCGHVLLTSPDVFFPVEGLAEIHAEIGPSSSHAAFRDHSPLDSDEAYVLFTSGSTGSPKGVSLSHGNLSSFLFACQQIKDLPDFKGIFSFTNIGFDLSVFENLFGLYAGKNIHVIENSEELWEQIRLSSGMLLNTVPSVLSRLGPEEISQLKVVFTAGEPFPESTWLHLKENNPDLHIFNLYGPTETTTYSTCENLSKAYKASAGKALLNELVFVLDDLGRKQPDFLPGEVVIGGAGVAKAYINSDNTPFFVVDGIPCYRTGDRGYMAENTLFLTGRIDRQVKRLGQRFELSEVENKITSISPEVSRSWYMQTGRGRFVLFLETEIRDQEVFRNILAPYFPEYMLPDDIFLLPAFPENRNGKLDKEKLKGLLSEEENGLDFQGDSDLLGRLKKQDPVFGPLRGNLGFIAQGGDSISGLRLISRLKQAGIQSDMASLLNAASVNEWLEGCQIQVTSVPVESAEPENPLTPVQEWFLNDYDGNKNHFNQSVLMELFIPVKAEESFRMVSEVFSGIPHFRMVFSGSSMDGLPPLLKFCEVSSEAEITAICSSVQKSFRLDTGPVAAAVIFHLDSRLILFVSIHHFYCDGFTWRILLDVLQQKFAGKNSVLPGAEIWGKVRNRIQNLALNSNQPADYYPETIFNPFSEQKICSYAESRFETREWSDQLSQVFLFRWMLGRPVNERVLSIFLLAWLSKERPRITPFFETHGRQHEDIPGLADCPGWFTQFYPLTSRRYPEKKEHISDYAAFAFQELPNNGLDYMGRSNWKKPPYPLLLNFLGNFDEDRGGLAGVLNLPSGDQADPGNPMLAYLEINALIIQGKVRWIFRSHPDFDLKTFVNNWEDAAQLMTEDNPEVAYIADEIGRDDLDTIAGLLNI
jgi:acyl-coenzyme A synthetase/AMP-(fatty) acid ligase/aryl carrier-like protein